MFLNDQETETDLLYYEAIAKTAVRLIRRTPGAPVTIGVHGDWGAGKIQRSEDDRSRVREGRSRALPLVQWLDFSKGSRMPRWSSSRQSSMSCARFLKIVRCQIF
jgi:hypothetical protein